MKTPLRENRQSGTARRKASAIAQSWRKHDNSLRHAARHRIDLRGRRQTERGAGE